MRDGMTNDEKETKQEQSLLNDIVWPLPHLGCHVFFGGGFVLDWAMMRETERESKRGEVVG